MGSDAHDISLFSVDASTGPDTIDDLGSSGSHLAPTSAGTNRLILEVPNGTFAIPLTATVTRIDAKVRGNGSDAEVDDLNWQIVLTKLGVADAATENGFNCTNPVSDHTLSWTTGLPTVAQLNNRWGIGLSASGGLTGPGSIYFDNGGVQLTVTWTVPSDGRTIQQSFQFRQRMMGGRR